MTLNEQDHRTLSDAIESGDAETVTRCLADFPELVNHPRWTPPPLHCAVLWDQAAIAELLLDYGADLEGRDPDQQTTPLRYAIMFAKVALIPLLLSRGAQAGPIEEGGKSAWQLAVEAADGAYESYEDLPRREAYGPVLRALREHGLGE